jgi:NADPH:quinone reductase-like Zn-dependent oxidoreductase
VDERVKVPNEQLLPCPPEVPGERLVALVTYWPAWRVTEWAGLEIGSRVLIIGDHGVANHVAQLCRWRGALWRGVLGGTQARTDVEYRLALRDGTTADEVLRALPARPDVAILLAGGMRDLRVATEVCRDGAMVVLAAQSTGKVDLNFYPDVHRRGIHIRSGLPFQYGRTDVEGWRRAARRITRLIGLGHLAVSVT